MKRIALYFLIAVVAAAAETPQELYQKALVKERSEGKLDEAIQLYRRAADSAGKDRALAAKALVQLGECYEKLEQMDEARSFYKKSVKMDPKLADAWFGVGVTLDFEERYFEALHFYKKALDLDLTNPDLIKFEEGSIQIEIIGGVTDVSLH